MNSCNNKGHSTRSSYSIVIWILLFFYVTFREKEEIKIFNGFAKKVFQTFTAPDAQIQIKCKRSLNKANDESVRCFILVSFKFDYGGGFHFIGYSLVKKKKREALNQRLSKLKSYFVIKLCTTRYANYTFLWLAIHTDSCAIIQPHSYRLMLKIQIYNSLSDFLVAIIHCCFVQPVVTATMVIEEYIIEISTLNIPKLNSDSIYQMPCHIHSWWMLSVRTLTYPWTKCTRNDWTGWLSCL